MKSLYLKDILLKIYNRLRGSLSRVLLLILALFEIIIAMIGISFNINTEVSDGISYVSPCSIDDFVNATFKYVESNDTTIYNKYQWVIDNKYWFNHLKNDSLERQKCTHSPLYITLPYSKNYKLTYSIDVTHVNDISYNRDSYTRITIIAINGQDVKEIPLLKRYLYKRNFDNTFLSKLQLNGKISDTPPVLRVFLFDMPKLVLTKLYSLLSDHE